MTHSITTDKGSNVSTVSRQWATRPDEQKFLSLGDLHTFTKGLADVSEETMVPAVNMAAAHTETGGIKLITPGRADDLTHFAFAQLARRAGAPANYLATLPAPLAAQCINTGLAQRSDEEKSKQVKMYSTDKAVRALLSKLYTRIYDHQIATSLMKIAGNGTGDARWKVPGLINWSNMTYDSEVPVSKDTTTLYASDRDLFCFLVDDRNPIEIGKLANGEPDLIFRGFYVWNSEVGTASCGLATMYLRGVCANRNLWGVEQFKEVTFWHLPTAKTKLIEEWEPALLNFANGASDKLVKGVAEARKAVVVAATGKDLAKLEDKRVEFLRKLGLPAAAARSVLKQHEEEEGKPASSLWDFAQGLTAFARKTPYQADRVQIEKIAGGLLDRVNDKVAA